MCYDQQWDGQVWCCGHYMTLSVNVSSDLSYYCKLLSRYGCWGEWSGGWVWEGISCWWSCHENATRWSTTDAISWHADDAHAAWNAGDAAKLPWNDDAICECYCVCLRSFLLQINSRHCTAELCALVICCFCYMYLPKKQLHICKVNAKPQAAVTVIWHDSCDL